MEKVIDKFSKGKIDIKFKLVHPIIENNKRKMLIRILNVLAIGFTVLVVKILQYFDWMDSFSLCIGLGTLWGIFEVVARVKLLCVREYGIIKFLSDSIQVENSANSVVFSFSYSEIKQIQYSFNMPGSFLGGSNYKTVVVQFSRYENSPIVVEVKRSLYLTREDENQFRSFEPNIDFVINNINPKYGVERINSIKMPITDII